MTQEALLKSKFADMDTEALRTLWRDSDRVGWAEHVLREELLERGASAGELDDISARREEIARTAAPSAADTLGGFGLLGRAAAIFIAFAIAKIAGRLWGMEAAALAVCVVAVVYLVVLVRRVALHFKHPTAGLAQAVMIWFCIEIVVITGSCLIAAYFVFFVPTVAP